MSALHSAAMHFAKRGVDAVRNSEIAQLKMNAAAFSEADLEDMTPEKFWPVFLTVAFALFIIASIDYTVGNVMTTLAMVESPQNAAVITLKDDAAPPAYTDEPDAPIEKKDLLSESLEETDVEVNFVRQKPITTSLRATRAHLNRVGGFRARWRGLGASIVYFGLHAVVKNTFLSAVGMGIVSVPFFYLLSSVLLSRVHMIWTHAMIIAPSEKKWYQRIPSHKEARALVLPTFVYCLAQMLVIAVPVVVAGFSGLDLINAYENEETNPMTALRGLGLFLRFLLIPVSAVLVAIFVTLPAKATLIRVEAALLPASESTIVHFDRASVVGALDLTSCRSHTTLFVNAWRSIDRATIRRVIRMEIKNFAIQLSVVFVAAHVVLAEVFVIGGEKLGRLIKAAMAEVQLAAIAHAQDMEPVGEY